MHRYGNFEIGLYLGTVARTAQLSSVSIDLLRWKDSLCATSETVLGGQISCPDMTVLKIGPHQRNRCPWSNDWLNFDFLG